MWFKKCQALMSLKEHIVNDPNFKSWFGNSKVVDKLGKPLIVYKGMYPYDYTKEKPLKSNQYELDFSQRGPELDTIKRPSPFPTFDKKDQEPVNVAGFFTDDPKIAASFAFTFTKGAVFPVFLRIENPKIFDANGAPSGTLQFEAPGKPFRDAVRSGQYDGVFILNTKDEGNVFIPLKPNQIKSAIHSKFNFNDPRFAY